MPRQINDPEVFLKHAESAEECRISRSGDRVKIKIRTPRYLLVHVASTTEADSILGRIKVEKIEF